MTGAAAGLLLELLGAQQQGVFSATNPPFYTTRAHAHAPQASNKGSGRCLCYAAHAVLPMLRCAVLPASRRCWRRRRTSRLKRQTIFVLPPPSPAWCWWCMGSASSCRPPTLPRRVCGQVVRLRVQPRWGRRGVVDAVRQLQAGLVPWFGSGMRGVQPASALARCITVGFFFRAKLRPGQTGRRAHNWAFLRVCEEKQSALPRRRTLSTSAL